MSTHRVTMNCKTYKVERNGDVVRVWVLREQGNWQRVRAPAVIAVILSRPEE